MLGLAEDIVQSLSSSIRDGKMLPGTKLPPEWALGEHFKVSRTVVREAVSQLKADGLVQSRRGSGVYIADAHDRRSFKLLETSVMDDDGLDQFFELREALEVSAAQLAAERRTESDLADLHATHLAMTTAPAWDTEGLDADTSFHQAIAVAAHSAFFADLLLYLATRLKESIRRARQVTQDPNVRSMVIMEHAHILSAIAKRDPQAARKAMQDHLRQSRQRMVLRGTKVFDEATDASGDNLVVPGAASETDRVHGSKATRSTSRMARS